MFLATKFLRQSPFIFTCRTAAGVPHRKKIASGGEDAYLLTDTVLSVADGVSWWGEQSLEPDENPTEGRETTTAPLVAKSVPKRTAAGGVYADEFVRNMYTHLREDCDGQAPSAIRLLRDAYDKSSDVVGTSTVTAACLSATNSGFLEVASIGDCLCMVCRGGVITFVTGDHSHGLDFPYQLGTGSADMPEDALVAETQVLEGDLVVIGSDGLFDNIFSTHVAKRFHDSLIALHKKSEAAADHKFSPSATSLSKETLSATVPNKIIQQTLTRVADELVREAFEASIDIRSDTPYARKCVQEGAGFEGGKEDDITLVVGLVGKNPFADGDRLVDDEFILPRPYKRWP